jgi:ABC-type nickel/cobalt efflux system permease component RcnA/ABC-type uncharacterized transport system substrate-binding protein
MKKIVLFLSFAYSLFACTLCSIYAPNAHITTIITSNEKNTSFNITWEFDKAFVDTLVVYDENLNNKFDDDEKRLIENALEVYLKQNDYLTYIALQNKDENVSSANIQKIKKPLFGTELDMQKFVFKYSFELPIVLEENKKLTVAYYDSGNNFNFIPKDTIVKNYNKTQIIELDKNQILIHFYNPLTTTKENNITKEVKQKADEISKNLSLLDKISSHLANYKQKIETLLKDIKENNSIISYIWLILFSFLYGLLHAMGPGHGKSLVGAYFLSENRSIQKAASISVLIGVVHTFSAFIMTLVVYYIFSVLFSNFFLDVEKVASKVSAVIIIIIALYMLFKKIKSNVAHKYGDHTCGCGGCQSKATDIGVIISSGIVPCPGTVTIFLFTFGLGIVFVGFVSAIAMSIGMSLVIFITAYLSTKVRKSSNSNKKLVKVLEYGSLLFILGLGIILFIV